MKKILITGYDGFIGRNLINALKGYRLIGVGLKNENLVDEHLSWSEIDELNNVDCIIHLAGKAHYSGSNKNFKEYYDVNFGLTKQIVNVFVKSNAAKFIYFSSVAAITDSLQSDEILTEAIFANPTTHYGKSKLAAENYINDQTLPEGKQVYILRPSMVHGPGNKGNLPMLFKYIQKGFPWPFGAYKNNRTFTYIGNLIFIIQQLIERNIEQGTYQVVDDEAVSTNDLVQIIAESLNKPVRTWNISPFIINLLMKVGDFFVLPISSFHIKKLTTSFEISNKKIKNALSIEKMPFQALDGLKKSIKELINGAQE